MKYWICVLALLGLPCYANIEFCNPVEDACMDFNPKAISRIEAVKEYQYMLKIYFKNGRTDEINYGRYLNTLREEYKDAVDELIINGCTYLTREQYMRKYFKIYD